MPNTAVTESNLKYQESVGKVNCVGQIQPESNSEIDNVIKPPRSELRKKTVPDCENNIEVVDMSPQRLPKNNHSQQSCTVDFCMN